MSEKALCEVNMTYATMRSYFRAAERARQHLSGFIVFSPASFDKEYSVESRTYAVSSDNKAFRPNIGGYSIPFDFPEAGFIKLARFFYRHFVLASIGIMSAEGTEFAG